MKAELRYLIRNLPETEQIRSTLSLRPFVRFVKREIAGKDRGRHSFFQTILNHIRAIPNWDKTIPKGQLEKFREIFELIYITLTSPISNECEETWALAEPFSNNIFFGTEGLYSFLNQNDTSGDTLIASEDSEAFLLERRKLIYALILDRLYNISYTSKQEIVHYYKNESTGLHRYFKLEYNAQFIDITYDGPLPKLDFSIFQGNQFDEEKNMATLAKVLPLANFQFEGISIVKFTDVTSDYVAEQIKRNIVDLASGREISKHIPYYLKTLLDNSNIAIQLFPIRKINGRLALGKHDSLERLLNEQCIQFDLDKTAYHKAIRSYVRNPRLLFYPDIDEIRDKEYDLISIIRQTCLKSVALIPIYFRKQFVGILEITSEQKNQLGEQDLATLSPVIPLLERLLKTIIDDFNLAIENVIKEKFTSLQPSVQWKFNEAAWHYLEQKKSNAKAEIDYIYFPDVFPLYGAVDIRNSTLHRNEALLQDMQGHLSGILNVLNHEKIKPEVPVGLLHKAREWKKRIQTAITPEDELYLNQFFQHEIHPFLKQLRKTFPKTAQKIDAYFRDTQFNGEFGLNQRQLEDSLQLINYTVREDLEKMNAKIQSIYPCYFETFRSDGMEYDIYIGQSITPQKPFKQSYLRQLRRLQLIYTAKITQKTHQLLPQLSKKLQTAQLIFVHTNPIDINFRNDERRFDVEGHYNIRYEMLKKRIDKVYIKNSQERLTQPGKIALIYFKKEDIKNYINFIREMQGNNILEENLEYLDLEDLQGVKDLKALRIGVKMGRRVKI